MNKQLLSAVAITALMAVPSLASANDQGWYVRGNVGYGTVTDMDFTGDLIGDVEGEGSGAASLGLGYEFGNNWRIELDGTQLWNDMGAISQASNTASDMRITTGMVNAIYDFNDFGAWKPYVGAGIGIARGSLSAQAHSFPGGNPLAPPVNNPTCPSFNACTFDRDDTATAWQLIAGLGYKINDNLTWDTQYRYLNVGELDYTGLGANLQAPTLTALGGTSGLATTAEGAGGHLLMTGLRYRFGAAAPKPVKAVEAPVQPTMYECWNGAMVTDLATCAPKPVEPTMYQCWDGVMTQDLSTCAPQTVAPLPPEPTQIVEYNTVCDSGDLNFIVYFPWDKSLLTDQAKAVVTNATDTAKQCGIDNIIIEGHADSSGSASYNVGLSSRRANRVESEIRANGVTTSNIVKSAKGENALFIDTGDGVREPLNRRTEVVIRLIPGTYITQ